MTSTTRLGPRNMQTESVYHLNLARRTTVSYLDVYKL
jgi:hypothetical protein